MKNNLWIWVIALIIVNTGWYFASQQGASQEINRPGAEFSSSRNAEASSLIGDTSEVEISHCFESTNGTTQNASVQIERDSKIIYKWEGTTDDGCVTKLIESEDGKLVIYTVVDDGVQSTVTLVTWPLKSSFIPGVVLFSVLTIAVAYGEVFVKKVVKKKIEKAAVVETEMVSVEVHQDTSSIWQDPVKL